MIAGIITVVGEHETKLLVRFTSKKSGRAAMYLAFLLVLTAIAAVALFVAANFKWVAVAVGVDGQSRFFGVPLGEGVFRRMVFATLFRTRAKVRLAVLPGAKLTNIIEISQAMEKAGWTNRHEEPNPYE